MIKKILIPFLGVFTLICLTPLVLAQLMNSNIDKKVIQLQKEGYQIKEIKKEIDYLSTKREFKLFLNEKLQKKYHLINPTAQIILTFKNLPITTANFEVHLNNHTIFLATKDLKHFKLKIDNSKQEFTTDKLSMEFILKLLNGSQKNEN